MIRASRIACLVLAASVVGSLAVLPARAGTLNGNVSDCINVDYKGSNNLGPAPDFQLSCAQQPGDTFSNGTGANQANLLFADKRTLAASASETLNLNSLTDPVGSSINFATVKFIKIRADKANTNNVVVGNAGSTPFLGPLGGTTPTVTIPPGGVALFTAPPAGWTTASANNLKVANSGAGTGVVYQIMVGGN